MIYKQKKCKRCGGLIGIRMFRKEETNCLNCDIKEWMRVRPKVEVIE